MITGFMFSPIIKGILTENIFRDTDIKIIKKIINKSLQVANRRLQNIEKSGVVSTAYKSLISELPKTSNKFSKLSIGKLDLSDTTQRVKALDTYSKALSFLNNKTSTVKGSKQFINKLAKKNNFSFSDTSKMIDEITDERVINGNLVINNWDSERIANMISEYSDKDNKYNTDIDKYIRQKIDENLSKQNDNFDIWDL
jgi:DNA-binding Lrp family transcriptional regulator